MDNTHPTIGSWVHYPKEFSTYEEVDDEHGDGDDDGGVELNNDRGQRPLRPLLRLTFAF